MRVEVAGDGGPALVLPAVAVDRATARNAAESRWRDAQRASRSGRVRLAAGNPAVAADVPIRLIGVREAVDGVWVPRRVVHTLSPRRGYWTEADIEVVTTQWNRASSDLPPGAAEPAGSPAAEPPDQSILVEVIGLEYPRRTGGSRLQLRVRAARRRRAARPRCAVGPLPAAGARAVPADASVL